MGTRGRQVLLTMLLAVAVAISAPLLCRAEGDPLELSIEDGDIVISEGGYTQAGGSLVSHAGPYRIVGADQGASKNTITIEGGVIDLTIEDLTVEAEDAPALYVKAGATLNLKVTGGGCSLTGGAGMAGICVEPAYDASWDYDADASAKLTISGDGTLAVTGGDGDAVGGTYGGGAGIGGNGEDQRGGDSVDFGTVIVSSGFTGTLEATGGASSKYVDGANAFGGGAGIGSGGFNMGYVNNYTSVSPYYWGEVFGSVEIAGGTIEATSEGNGSGIGGGGGQGEDTAASHISVTIAGGIVTSVGGTLGAGIGGGAICDGGTISISGSGTTVVAEAGPNEDSIGAAGIGGGNDASVSAVTISGGCTVEATASGGAAGIGGGTNTSYSNVHYGDEDGTLTPDKVGTISISGEGTSVIARGSTGEGYSGLYGGAGIGSGYPTANNARSVA